MGANGWLLMARWPALALTLPNEYIRWLLAAQVGAFRTRLTYRLPVRLLSMWAVLSAGVDDVNEEALLTLPLLLNLMILALITSLSRLVSVVRV